MKIMGVNKREEGDGAFWIRRIRAANPYNLERMAKKTFL